MEPPPFAWDWLLYRPYWKKVARGVSTRKVLDHQSSLTSQRKSSPSQEDRSQKINRHYFEFFARSNSQE
jgi:hypothetical protein